MSVSIIGEGRVARLIEDTAAQLSSEGAWFNPDLEIQVDGSNVSVVSRNAFTDRRSVIRVPVASMPVLDDFDVTLSGDDFQCTPKGDSVSDAQVRMMNLMLDTYNALDKIPQWKRETPWFALLEHPDVLDHLISGRPRVARLHTLKQMGADGDVAEMANDTFIGSRKFNLSPQNCKAIGREEKDGVKVLLPIIDFFNHRMSAQGFKISDVPSPASMRIQAVPDKETGELFVRYNVFDALDTYLYYGFVDADVGYMSSVPCTLSIGDITLTVIGGGGRTAKTGKLAPALKDLRLFIPSLNKSSDNQFQANKMVIPGPRAPRALRRVLAVLMNTLQVPRDKVEAYALKAEQDLLDQNEAWWTALADKVADVPADNGIHDLVKTGLGHIAQYRGIVEKMTAA
ncbi:MAG: hypothetical protein AAF801_00055 [Pseudomonadota bacterium]